MQKKHQVLLIICFAVLLITFRYFNFPGEDTTLKKFKGKKITVCGFVVGEPTIKISGTKFVLRTGGESCKGDSYIEVRVREVLQNISHNQMVKVEGRLSVPENIVDEEGRIFDYVGYLRKDKIFYQINQARIVEMGVEKKNIHRALLSIKKSIMGSIEENLPTPHSLLASGLIISGKGSMSKELQTEFQRVGLIHIVVLSGSNVSIIGEVIFKIFSFLPNVLGALLGSIGVIFFSVMVGGSATVIRSTVMSLIGIFARVTGRSNSALVSLTVAGALMLIWNPLLLIYDPSFQLSFLASIGLILYSPRVESVLKKILIYSKGLLSLTKDKQNHFENMVVEIVSSSLGTQVTTLPFIIKMSGLVSIVSLPVNILLLPLIPYTMLLVFITGVTGFISSYLVIIPSYVSWAMLHVILETVHYFSSLNFAVYEFGLVDLKIIYVFYILLALEYTWYIKNKNRFLKKKPV